MELVATASLITAFLAGVAALFAPCCIGVLLPTYLASVFRTKKKIFLMTFVYYLGLLTVFLPLGLGMAWLGTAFSDYHAVLFTVGGLFMLLLGFSLVLGKSYMLPMKVKPSLKGHDVGSLYVLGIFSGIATSCCAPVLAGVLALSVLPGSLVLGPIYALVFVTGMALPLFIMAFFIDRAGLMERFKSMRRQVSYTLLGREIKVHLSHLVSGLLFIAVGLFILIFERSSPEGVTSYQIDINIITAQLTSRVNDFVGGVPEYVWALLFIGVFVAVAWAAYRQAVNDNNDKKEKNNDI